MQRGQAWRLSCGVLCRAVGFLLPGVASLHLGFASADFLIVISSSLQFPGWSQGAEGSLVIALGNEDALGEYACTPYNSLGTAGPSPVTRVLLKVRPRVSHSGGAGGWRCTLGGHLAGREV